MEYNIEKLNEDIKQFPQVHPITADMKTTFEGVSRLVMLDRYAFKDTEKKTLGKGDIVVVTIKPDPQFPTRGIGYVNEVTGNNVLVELLPEYYGAGDGYTEMIDVPVEQIDKPLEVFYEQIANRVARGLAEVEDDEDRQGQAYNDFYMELASLNFVPAGRVLYGAGSDAGVTFFNCFVMPFPKDSREGISEHRGEVMEIMSRGGGKLIPC